MDDNRVRHLEMIQGVVNRMGQNAFLLKGWTVTLVAGLFVFANTQDIDYKYVAIALLPAIFFWLLDGYFLWQERLFRKLYDAVRKQNNETAADFSMDVRPFYADVHSWLRTCFSITLSLFYLPTIGVIVITLVLVWTK
ncbi:hypothetical protein [Neobacillus kokaensis]|uniref:DUF3899 domain-containing protein n=1 Tax=Neobacillus kokaensis TaxID=2759023 RepID=A0ABQ3NC22_9BACI|nr:hypothetical protein [Neobacillus kokaensis]GHI01455.1 hypothetical protein AM1BK_49970 [Neobacillus kokaensis]